MTAPVLNFLTFQVPPIFELDTTDVSNWEEAVRSKAIAIIENYLNGTPCEYKPLESNLDEERKKLNARSNNYCEVCQRLIIGDKEYAIHMKSNRHMKVLKKKKQLQEKMEQEDKSKQEISTTSTSTK